MVQHMEPRQVRLIVAYIHWLGSKLSPKGNIIKRNHKEPNKTKQFKTIKYQKAEERIDTKQKPKKISSISWSQINLDWYIRQ